MYNIILHARIIVESLQFTSLFERTEGVFTWGLNGSRSCLINCRLKKSRWRGNSERHATFDEETSNEISSLFPRFLSQVHVIRRISATSTSMLSQSNSDLGFCPRLLLAGFSVPIYGGYKVASSINGQANSLSAPRFFYPRCSTRF